MLDELGLPGRSNNDEEGDQQYAEFNEVLRKSGLIKILDEIGMPGSWNNDEADDQQYKDFNEALRKSGLIKLECSLMDNLAKAIKAADPYPRLKEDDIKQSIQFKEERRLLHCLVDDCLDDVFLPQKMSSGPHGYWKEKMDKILQDSSETLNSLEIKSALVIYKCNCHDVKVEIVLAPTKEAAEELRKKMRRITLRGT